MIEVTGLVRSYGAQRAVDDVSFSIGVGEVVGLLGHNGAGKTTIMKMLTGSLEPDSGSIGINGLDPERDRRATQRLIGYLPENCPLYPEMTVIDFLDYQAGLHGMPANERAAAIGAAMRRTWLVDRATQTIGTLSRGYRQRVGVAQALLHRPQIVILDEPTNGLDPTQIHQMRALIRELAQSATVILSTHILQEVEAVCDRVLVLRAGRLALDRKLTELGAGTGSIVVELDAAPDWALPTLRGVDGVSEVVHRSGSTQTHVYTVRVTDGLAGAAAIAQAVQLAGLKLYRLNPGGADLETVFRELHETAARKAAGHA
ncbi:MAG: ATP-binding cassette domain-containing protein [Chromatiales bacterium]|nr:ATP-binding cassette domain-containing protein [Chromatiales bacterium]